MRSARRFAPPCKASVRAEDLAEEPPHAAEESRFFFGGSGSCSRSRRPAREQPRRVQEPGSPAQPEPNTPAVHSALLRLGLFRRRADRRRTSVAAAEQASPAEPVPRSAPAENRSSLAAPPADIRRAPSPGPPLRSGCRAGTSPAAPAAPGRRRRRTRSTPAHTEHSLPALSTQVSPCWPRRTFTSAAPGPPIRMRKSGVSRMSELRPGGEAGFHRAVIERHHQPRRFARRHARIRRTGARVVEAQTRSTPRRGSTTFVVIVPDVTVPLFTISRCCPWLPASPPLTCA